MEIPSYKYVYLVGVGGIGMSALARYFNHQGFKVAGYDRTETELTRALASEGVDVHYDDSISLIPSDFRSNPADTLVIYTPAIPSDHSELNYLIANGFKVIKRSVALGVIAASKRTLGVAGTHGKTTTSTLLSHLLVEALGGVNAFLGGIAKNYSTNLLLSKNDVLVAEADEFDRSFLQLFPNAAVITSTDADHLDIYGSHEAVLRSFADFINQIKPGGALVLKQGVEVPLENKEIAVYRYSIDKGGDYHAENIVRNSNGTYTFDIVTPKTRIEACTLGVPGWINVENAIAAVALALTVTDDTEALKRALASFGGVKRRFDFYINTPTLTFLDDYAHHPEELRASISSVKAMFPNRKVCGIFQPHLYTRTRDFAEGFAQSLSLLDEVILLDIYPARELPIEGVTSQIIFEKITASNKVLITKSELLDVLSKREIDVLMTVGAGDIDKLVEPIADMLKNRYSIK
ncbi:UDP-N-acetylmuramate--L-alanine ligase [Acetobacteroides hydrogenigenes]|uniref:UDP-N-acetylmuramate--L-alanine ligase n=1 Tax=Acetobacteroides hydrogenigenes TaxID=979970 RepID=A0A4V2RNB0_9BACT|nr:UDP-N-acetylmuramate--L-alanine ligase [Acetobacteroides hydrogenigenes]TCN63040.1 UDP-N-acetylmuramate--alanine ligase [Acetobacteroides hydrogenigenes]